MADHADTVPRGTDHPFYQLMKLSGSSVLKLLGFPPEQAEQYHFDATVLKQRRLEPDMQGIPSLDSAAGRVFVEFQGYTDEFILYRLVAEALTACQLAKYRQHATIGVIFTDAVYQQAALALDNIFPNNALHITQVVLSDYELKELLAIDPKLIILAPFCKTSPVDKATLQQQISDWTQQLRTVYPEPSQHNALNILSLFILDRFRNLSYEEVMHMMRFNLLETRAGQDMFRMGEEQGIEKGELRITKLHAQMMLEQGIDIQVIMQITGLSEQELAALTKQQES